MHEIHMLEISGLKQSSCQRVGILYETPHLFRQHGLIELLETSKAQATSTLWMGQIWLGKLMYCLMAIRLTPPKICHDGFHLSTYPDRYPEHDIA